MTVEEGVRGRGRGLLLAGLRLPSGVASATGLDGRAFDIDTEAVDLQVRFGSGSFRAPDLSVEEASIEIWIEDDAYIIGDQDSWTNQLALRVVLAHRLWVEGGLVIHASAVAQDGVAVIFPAHSGQGKSTIADNAMGRRLADDTIVVRGHGDGLMVYGTPFGRPRVPGSPEALPLGAVCFPDKGKDVRITPMQDVESFIRRLSSQIFAPPGAASFSPPMWNTLLDMAETVPAFDLRVPLGYRFERSHLEGAG